MIVSAAQEHELILSVLTGRGARPDTADLQARWWPRPQARRPSATAGKGILRTDCKAERNSW